MKLSEPIITTSVHEERVYTTENLLEIHQSFVDGEETGIYFTYLPNAKDMSVVFLDEKKAFAQKEFKNWLDSPEWLEKHKKSVSTLSMIDKYTPYLWYWPGHILFNIQGRPVSLPVNIDYIGSIKQVRHNKIYEKLMDLIKVHPWFQRVEEIEIPGYNSDFYGQKAISAQVHIPQEEYEKLYEIFKNQEYWSVQIEGVISLSYKHPEYDLYGDEITSLLVEYYKNHIQDD